MVIIFYIENIEYIGFITEANINKRNIKFNSDSDRWHVPVHLCLIKNKKTWPMKPVLPECKILWKIKV